MQSHPGITAAGDQLTAPGNDAFWDYARPLGEEGDLAFVSPELLRLADALAPPAKGAPPTPDLWFVSRTVRIPGEGVLRRTRSAIPPPGWLPRLLELAP